MAVKERKSSSRTRNNSDYVEDIVSQVKELDMISDKHSVSTSGSNSLASTTLVNLQNYIDSQLGKAPKIDNTKENDSESVSFVESIVNQVSDTNSTDTDSRAVLGSRTKVKSSQGGGNTRLDNDRSLNKILGSLARSKESKSNETVSSASEGKWESRVEELARLLDAEKEKSIKLAEVQGLLNGKKKKLKADIKLAKWEAQVQELEGKLSERRKEKEIKLILLANTLEDLKKEKLEMKKIMMKAGKRRISSKKR